jgi:DNA-binding beta-propeller fold protein YncE
MRAMRARLAVCCLACLTIAVLSEGPTAFGSAENRYEQVRDWPKLPSSVPLGECAGVAVDSKGHVLIFHRPGRGFEPGATTPLPDPAVLEVDAESGALVRAWGANRFAVPHGISVDSEDNVYLTDVALQQVFKFNHDGTLILALGAAGIGGWDATHFNQPTDVQVRADGTFYVSDGYINSRVALFDARGTHLREWGRKGSGEGEFSNPHGLTLLPRSTDVLVADRENARLQLFDKDGRFKRQWAGQRDAETTGRVFAVAAAPDGNLFVGIRREDYDTQHTGVLKLDRDFRIRAAIGFGNPGDPVFNAVHDLALGRDGSIYVAETRTKRVVKLRPVS